jgi:murein DD-endopeptidase MepM/ murein hydrolase activator NlpD
MNNILSWLRGSEFGSNNVSLFLRKKIESMHIRQFIGVNLACLTFFAAIILPQTHAFVSTTEVYFANQDATISVPTTSTPQWPLTQFTISQYFSIVHPGVDLPAPVGTPIYPIYAGKVIWTMELPWGYGRHVFISHNKHLSALYAHMSKIEVKAGDFVTQNTQIGLIGSTGWSTGNHLHLEIYQNHIPVNPIEVLPNLTKQSDLSVL